MAAVASCALRLPGAGCARTRGELYAGDRVVAVSGTHATTTRHAFTSTGRMLHRRPDWYAAAVNGCTALFTDTFGIV